jgi:hypothetical protein
MATETASTAENASEQSVDIDTSRRSLFGRATAGAFVAASVGAIGLLRPGIAHASGISGWYDVKADFGAAGNGTTDDTTALTNAINAGSANQLPIFFPPGQYKITSALAIPSNTMIIGSSPGLGFGCTIQPNACAAFNVGGATSAFQVFISDLTIYPAGTAPDHIISVDNSYSVLFQNVRIYNTQSALTTAAILLLGDPTLGGTGHGTSNNIIWENIVVRNDSIQPIAAVVAQAGCGTHRFIEPDFECYYDLFDWYGGQIDILLPYFERSGRYSLNCEVNSTDPTAFLNTYGGLISCSPSAFCCAFNSAPSFNSFSTLWKNTGSTGTSVYVFSALSSAAQFHGTVPNVSGSGASLYTGVTGWQRSLTFPGYTLKASKAWSVTVPAAGQSTTTVTVTGVLLGSHCARANMSVSLGGVQMTAYVSAADTVTVVAQNNTTSGVALSGTLFVEASWM